MSLQLELKSIIKLAWPLLIAQITQTLMGVADTIMAGRYSSTDMAAVAIGFSITMPVIFFIQGLILALPPIISRLNGGQKLDKIANATQQMAWLLAIVSCFTALLTFAVPSIFSHIGMEAELRSITVDYIQALLLSTPAFAAYQILRNYCEGLSVTKPTMVIMVLGLLVNIPANYILIYGKFGIDPMGGAGCGVATAIVFFAMFLASLVYVLQAKQLKKYHLFTVFYPPNFNQIWHSFKLGIPIAMTILFEVTLFGVVALLLSPFGSTTVAAHQIALNFSSLMFMVPLSVGMAISIRVGHKIGENDQVGAKTAVKSALLLGLATASFTAFMTITARTLIPALYTKEAVVIELAASLMSLAAMFQLSDAVQVISAGALRGYKDTKAMFYFTFIAYWLVGLPIGCVLALTDVIVPQMGAAGFWIGFICGLTAAAIMLGFRLKYIQANFTQLQE